MWLPDPVAVKAVTDFFTDPKLWAFVSVVTPVLGYFAGIAVSKQPEAKKFAQEIADMSELVEPWVRGAEKLPFATGRSEEHTSELQSH